MLSVLLILSELLVWFFKCAIDKYCCLTFTLFIYCLLPLVLYRYVFTYLFIYKQNCIVCS